MKSFSAVWSSMQVFLKRQMETPSPPTCMLMAKLPEAFLSHSLTKSRNRGYFWNGLGSFSMSLVLSRLVLGIELVVFEVCFLQSVVTFGFYHSVVLSWLVWIIWFASFRYRNMSANQYRVFIKRSSLMSSWYLYNQLWFVVPVNPWKNCASMYYYIKEIDHKFVWFIGWETIWVVGRTLEGFVNHSPAARDLQIFLVFYQHPAWFISL